MNQYLGSPISLISKSGIRYEGILENIDRAAGQVHLKNVYALGTEGRRLDGPQIPPQQNMFSFIIFRGTDIQTLKVISTMPVQPVQEELSDPAIVSSVSSTSQHGGFSSFGAAPQQPMASSANGPALNANSSSSGNNATTASAKTSAGSRAKADDNKNKPAATPKMWNLPNAKGPSAPVAASAAPANTSGQGYDKRERRPQNGSHGSQGSQGQGQGQSQGYNARSGPNTKGPKNPNYRANKPGTDAPAERTQHHRNKHTSSAAGGKDAVPEGEFDYVQSTSKFDKSSLLKEVGEDDAAPSAEKKPVFEDNFYDSLSSEVTGKGEDDGKRPNDRKHTSRNVETFGKARVYHNNYRPQQQHHRSSNASKAQ